MTEVLLTIRQVFERMEDTERPTRVSVRTPAGRSTGSITSVGPDHVALTTSGRTTYIPFLHIIDFQEI